MGRASGSLRQLETMWAAKASNEVTLLGHTPRSARVHRPSRRLVGSRSVLQGFLPLEPLHQLGNEVGVEVKEVGAEIVEFVCA
jgi:hypothetical protein